jgi:hypothetical protein
MIGNQNSKNKLRQNFRKTESDKILKKQNLTKQNLTKLISLPALTTTRWTSTSSWSPWLSSRSSSSSRGEGRSMSIMNRLKFNDVDKLNKSHNDDISIISRTVFWCFPGIGVIGPKGKLKILESVMTVQCPRKKNCVNDIDHNHPPWPTHKKKKLSKWSELYELLIQVLAVLHQQVTTWLTSPL